MTPSMPNRPRIGIPWRTSEEEAQANRPRIKNYEDAVRKAGAEPVLLSLGLPQKLQQEIAALDGFVLPGSPADVAPAEYGDVNHGHSAAPDQSREATDRAILKHAFAAKKPVLAICYGCQLLNVYLGGTLIQDVRVETGTSLPHRKKDLHPEPPDDPLHGATFDPSSKLAMLAGATSGEINSSHHQAIARPGEKLRVTAHATDGTIEGVEWIGDDNWVVGVQWHPERMAKDEFAARLFREFVAVARRACAVRS
ncbi:MAG: gamma-glutamyl-gamma-aminobutyrate hydrolase family protein [Candidatus Acidiferrum sp.]